MDSELTFAQLNIPFPLFEVPVRQAEEYLGLTQCTLCGNQQQHCFLLGIGSEIIINCATCGTQNALLAFHRRDEKCRNCGHTTIFPFDRDEERFPIHACYQCLREGRAVIIQNTELGMISWDEMWTGLTHGKEGLNHPDFELVAGSDGLLRARLEPAIMYELLRTPTFTDRYAEWLFCCRNPMIFIGDWEQEDFARHAPDGNGKALFDQIVENIVPGLWENTLRDEDYGWEETRGIYVFRCSQCRKLRANWDSGIEPSSGWTLIRVS